jgi:hypothetical protein
MVNKEKIRYSSSPYISFGTRLICLGIHRNNQVEYTLFMRSSRPLTLKHNWPSHNETSVSSSSAINTTSIATSMWSHEQYEAIAVNYPILTGRDWFPFVLHLNVSSIPPAWRNCASSINAIPTFIVVQFAPWGYFAWFCILLSKNWAQPPLRCFRHLYVI